ncbi:MAG TPA: TIGR00645 family protein [Solirubrobacterales bacterium]|jgi:uncharacterized protein (TIGR00645 family)|nr:TIGR00645 family protein [Solirubrobacterales bacterium]HMU27776.1 TIGR00645 family protein [Solirubrobacterales bacterium]HMX70738.1 TIGR00645 family protein [Solirubrobacterales bacterium]HNA24893.1 TIGR00645 family protein [Solirubrobacterales bacterium]HNA44701.1 TIGR00645 family protein [Solirubrobacterales bacterium]
MSAPPLDPAPSPSPPSDERPGMDVTRPRTPAGMIGWSIFASRWIQAPLYLGLIVAQAVYVVKFWKELVHLITDFSSFDENAVMLTVLGLVDVVMIANLLIMVIIGGYETFVSRIKVENHPDQPEWLSHVNANVLKVKLAMAIVGISSIHLLKTFIEYGTEETGLTSTEVMWQTIIHFTFVLSAIGLAYIDRYLSPTKDDGL